MNFKTVVENQEEWDKKLKRSRKVGQELDDLLLNMVTKTIKDFMKKKVYQPNVKAVDDLIHSDIVLAMAFEGLYNFSKGGYDASRKALAKEAPRGEKLY